MFDFDPEKEFQFLGIFWLPNNPDNTFTGSLSYTPEDGISLETTAELKPENSFLLNEEKESYIFGHCNELGDVTLIYCAPNGYEKNTVFYRKYQIIYALTNIHYQANVSSFDKISFHFKELNSFCSKNQDNLSVISFNDIFSCDLDDEVHFSIKHGIKNAFMLGDILCTSFNDIDVEMLKQVREKAGNLTVSKPFFCISISKKNTSLLDFLALLFQIEKLFSVFLYQPVHTIYISLYSGKEKHRLIWKPYQKSPDNNNLFYPFLPINIEDIKYNFPEIWRKWNETTQEIKYNSLITDKFFNNMRFGNITIGVILSAINEWQKKNGNETKKQLYENFLKESFCEDNPFNVKAKEILKSILSTDDFEIIGRKLTKIRGVFLHEAGGRQSKEQDLVKDDAKMRNLSETLFLFLTRRIMLHIGIIFNESDERLLGRNLPAWETLSL